MPVGSSAQALAISEPRVAASATASSAEMHAGDRVGGDLADRVAGHDGRRRLSSRPRLVSSSWASSVAATTSGWVTAVSVISSAVAVVPRRARSRPLTSDQTARRSAAPGSSSHGGEHAGSLRSLSGSKQRKHGVWARIKRTL